MSPTSYRTAPPRVIQTSALEVVGLGRVELPTSRLSGVRSNQLSYRPLVSPATPMVHHFCRKKEPHFSRYAPPSEDGGRARGPCSFGGFLFSLRSTLFAVAKNLKPPENRSLKTR